MSCGKEMIYSSAGVDSSADALLEEEFNNIQLNDDIEDEDPVEDEVFVYQNVDPKDLDYNDDLDNIDIPPEVDDYLNKIVYQTRLLEEELLLCDETLKDADKSDSATKSSSAVVLYEDVKMIEEAAAEAGLSVEEFKQKVLKEVAEDDFNEDKLISEYDEFVNLQKEFAALRSDIEESMQSAGDADLLLAIEAPNLEVDAVQSVVDLDPSELTSSKIVAEYQKEHSLSHGGQIDGQLVSMTALSCMKDFIQNQLRKNEEFFQARQQKLIESIESLRQQEEKQLLTEETRKILMQQQIDEEQAAILEKTKERQTKLNEELKLLDDGMKEEIINYQVKMDQITEDLTREKSHYEAIRAHLLLSLEETKRKAATKIQKVFRGYRVRKENRTTIKKLEELTAASKEERFNIRVMEVEYEMKYREQQAKKEKEKEEAERKIKENEDKKQKQLEEKKKEEEKRMAEEKKRELEIQKEAEKLEEERRRQEIEKQKEMEKMKKMEEKKQKEEEKKRMKEEERLRKEEEKRKKEEVKRLKDEEKKQRQEEEKRLKQKEEEMKLKEIEERKLREKERLKSEDQAKLTILEDKNDKLASGDGAVATTITTTPKEPTAAVTNLDLNTNNNNLTANNDACLSPVVMVNLTPHPPPFPQTPQASPLPCPFEPLPHPGSSPSAKAMPASEPFPVTLTPQPDPIEKLRLSWITSCLPWSKVSNEPWKLSTSSQGIQKRPVSARKKLPPVSEAIVLSAAQAETLRQVSSVALCDLPGCSLSTLAQCWSLKCLTITHCNVVCLDSISSCKHLLYINAEYNAIEYMDLKDLGSLQVLKLANNKLNAIHGLDGCINLRYLDLSHNNIAKLGGMGSLRRLHTLNLSHNQVISSDGLDKVVTLQELDLSHNFLQQLGDVRKLCLLTRLSLASNNLVQVPELTNQVLLQILELQENSIKSLKNLDKAWLPLLHTFNCSGNMLESLEGVSHFIMLRHLDICSNQITEYEHLAHVLESLQQLESLNLEGNPVAEVDRSGTQLIPVKLKHLKCFNGEELQRLAVEESLNHYLGNLEFYQTCRDQIQLHTNLKNELDNQLKSYLSSSKASNELICQVIFSYCETSFRLANDHRMSHEYSSVDAPSSTTKNRVVAAPMTKADHVSDLAASGGLTSAAANKAKFSETFNQPKKSNKAEENNTGNRKLTKVASGKKDKNGKLDKKPSNYFDHDDDMSSILSDDMDVTDDNTVSYPPIPPPTLSSYINEKDKFNLALAGNTGRNLHSNLTLAEKESQNLHLKENENNNYSLSLNQASDPLLTSGHPETGQSSNMKGRFDAVIKSVNVANGESPALAAQQSQGSKDSQKGPHWNYNSASPLPVVKADVVVNQLGQEELKEWLGDIDLDQLVTIDNDAAFDIDKYLDMDFELDEFLDVGWRPADEPQVPLSAYPVLRNIQPTNGSVRPAEQPAPPAEPLQAWSQAVDRSKVSQAGHGVVPPLSYPSPVPSSVASVAETISAGRNKAKTDEILQDWGFKDAHTAELMLARAKKMKYNAERKRKLSKLDPKQRLLLFRKLEESGKILSVRPPNVKTLPRKEYFQAREDEMVRQDQQRQAEKDHSIGRTYEWLHTQVGDYPITSSRINPGTVLLANFESAADKTVKAEKLWDARKASPLSDHKSSSGSGKMESQRNRRFSLGDDNAGLGTSLPPINKQDRLSFRDTPVDKSLGWGGGKKRGRQS